jgi:Methylamine utilisation protein MauE
MHPVEDSQMILTERLRTLPVSLLRELPRFILIGLFSFAAIDKLIHFRGFVTAIQSYQLLPSRLESFAAIFFIMAEFAIALGLLTKRWRGPACLSAVLLLGTFTVVYLAVDPGRVCGCWFTLTLNSGGYFHILQNLVFIALAILTWMDHRSSKPDALSVSYSTSTSTAESDDGRLKHA